MLSRREFISSGILTLMSASLGIKVTKSEPEKKPLKGWMMHGYGVIDSNRVLLATF